MNGDETGKKSATEAQSMNRAALRAVVGAYLIYLGVSLIRDRLNGKSAMALWLAWACGAFFALAGAGVIAYTWLRWRREQREREKTEDAQSGD